MPTVRNLLFSAVHFFVVVALLAVGGFCVALGNSVLLRARLIDALSHASNLFLFAGLILLGISALLIYGFYKLSKGHFFQVKMGPVKDVEVDARLIAGLAREYFSTLFPDTEVLLDIVIHRGREIEVLAALPDPSDSLLQQVEKELGGIFAKYLNYKESFILTVAIP